MTLEQELVIADAFHKECRDVLASKAHDYNPDDDKLSSFKKIGHMMNVPVENVFDYFITTKITRIIELNGKTAKNESMHDSLVDLANYAFLKHLYLKEQEK